MIKAVIFDMDGTLVNTELLWLKSTNIVLKPFGIRISKKEYCNWTGKNDFYEIKKALEKNGMNSNEAENDANKLVAQRNKVFLSLLRKLKLNPDPNLAMAINFFKSKNKKIALATSTKAEIEKKVLEKINYSNVFDAEITFNDVTKKKPDPEIYILCAKKLGVKTHECLVFEDSAAGVDAAKNAGMKCIAVPNSYSACQDFSRADCIVKNRKIITKAFLEKWLA